MSFLIEDILNKYKTSNNLVKGMMYQLNDLSDYENKVIYITKFIQDYFNKKYKTSYNLLIYASIIIYLYNSMIIIYNLPSFNNKSMHKNKPSLHILYNEGVCQLISMSFFSESLYLFTLISTKNNISQIENKNIYKKNSAVLTDSYFNNYNQILINNDLYSLLLNKNITKEEKKIKIENSLDEYKTKLLKNLTQLCINFFKVLNIYSDDDETVINQVLNENIN